MGPQVFIDVVPAAFNARFVVTAGNAAAWFDRRNTPLDATALNVLFWTDSTSVCSAEIHFFVFVLVWGNYALLALLAWFGVGGGGVAAPITLPFALLSIWFGALLVLCFFLGITAVLRGYADYSATAQQAACLQSQPALYGA